MTRAVAPTDTAGRGIAAGGAIPTLAVAAAVTAWGFGGIMVKLASFEGVALSFYRLWLGFAVMFLILHLMRRPLSVTAVRAALPGGLLFGVNVAMFFTGIKLTTVANATLVSALQPALVLLVAGAWFSERVGLREVFWTGVSFAGVVVVILGSAGAPAWSPIGDLLAVGALFTFTGYFLVSKRIRSSVDPVQYVAAIQFIAAVVVTPIALVTGPRNLVAGGPIDWLWMVMIVLVSGLGGHLLVNWAHRYVDVSISSLLMLGVPIVAALGAWAVLAEPLGPLQILGGLIALAAIVVIVRTHEPAVIAESAPASHVAADI